jgi:hypothetical protein
MRIFQHTLHNKIGESFESCLSHKFLGILAQLCKQNNQFDGFNSWDLFYGIVMDSTFISKPGAEIPAHGIREKNPDGNPGGMKSFLPYHPIQLRCISIGKEKIKGKPSLNRRNRIING